MKTVDRRTILSSGALALASAATRSAPAAAQTGLKPIFSVPAITVPIVGEEGSFPVLASIALGAIMPPTPSNAAPIRTANRHSSFRSRLTRSRTSPSERSRIIHIPRLPRTITTKSSWLRR